MKLNPINKVLDKFLHANSFEHKGNTSVTVWLPNKPLREECVAVFVPMRVYKELREKKDSVKIFHSTSDYVRFLIEYKLLYGIDS